MSSLAMRRAVRTLENLVLGAPDRDTVEEFAYQNAGAVLTDARAIVKTTNHAFTANVRASILGKNCNCLERRGDTRNDISNLQIRNALKARRAVVTHLVNHNLDGHEYLVVISIRPIVDANGTLRGYYSLQLPMLHVIPYRGSLPMLIPPSERHPYRRFYETDYTREEASLAQEIDVLFPDIVGQKRDAILKQKEERYLTNRLRADEKAKVRTQRTMRAFEGYDKFVEAGISSDSEDSMPDSASEDECVFLLPDIVVSHPLVYRLKALCADERLRHLDELRRVASGEFFEAVEAADVKRVTFLLETLSNTEPWLLHANVFNEKDLTACHIAAHRGDMPLLQLLVARGANLLCHRWHYTVWAHALNSISKGLGCTQEVLDWLKINGAENLAIMGERSVVGKYTQAYRKAYSKSKRSR